MPIKQLRKILPVIIVVVIFFVAGCAGISVRKELKPQILPEEIPEEVRLTLNDAEKAFRAGRMVEAEGLYGDILRRVDSGKVTLWAHLRRGEIFIGARRYNEALRELDLVTKRSEEDPLYNEARYGLALSCSGLEDYKASNAIANGLLSEKIDPYLRARTELMVGDNLMKTGENADALTRYVNAVKERVDGKVVSRAKNNIEDIIDNYLSVDQLEALDRKYGTDYPSGYVLCSLVRSCYESGNIEDTKKYIKKFLYHHRKHPCFDEIKKLDRRISESESISRYSIGCILPLTGEYAPYGNRALDAVILAADLFGEGRNSSVELFIEDSKSDAEVAGQVTSKLIGEHKVMGIIGPIGNFESIEAAKKAQSAGVPIITLAQSEDVANIGDYVFRDSVTGAMQAERLVRYSVENLGMKKFAILYPSDDYGTEMMNLFRDEVLRQGGEICRVESYAIDQTDFSKEIKLLTGINLTENDTGDEEPSPIVNFDVLFIPDSYLRIRMIAPQLAFYNVTNVQLMGTSIWNSPDLLAKDSNYLEGAIFADGLFLGSFRHDAGNFIDRFYASFRREPCTLEAVAYDATDIMIKAIEKKNTEIRDDLKDSILRYKNNDNIIGKTSFSETGNAVKSLYILTVMDGEIVQID